MPTKNKCSEIECCEIVCGLTKKLQEVENANSLLKNELTELRSKNFGFKKRDKKKTEKQKSGKKKGAPAGHPGHFRKTPEKIDVVEEVSLEECPICRNKHITECSEVEEHIQEDIILPVVKATKYRKHHYWCAVCKRVVSGKGQDEIPNSKIGPKAKSVESFLKYIVKVSDRDIKIIFRELCGLDISASSVHGFNTQIRKKCQPLYEELKNLIRAAEQVHADETGCPMDGENWWNWVFATTNICLFVIRHSRGQKVVEEILGKKYGGILISDFYCAYNGLDAKAKQRCLVHLLRDLKRILESYAPQDPCYEYCLRLKKLLQKAIELSADYCDHKIAEDKFQVKKESLKQQLGDFQFPDPQKGLLNRIAKRLKRHKDQIFTFLDYPGLPYHNNFAERLIRPSVIFRKITFGHRAEKGTLNHSVIRSVLQTGKLNGKESIGLIKDILTSRKTPAATMCTGP